MRAVNWQLQSICFFLSTRAAKLSAYHNQSTTHQNSVFGGERTNKGFTILWDYVISITVSNVLTHLHSWCMFHLSLYAHSPPHLCWCFNFQSLCKSSAKLLCDSKVTSWNWQRTKSGILMRSWHLPNLNLKTSCICPIIHALVKPKT